ncbi:MAG: tetratricopeptide repeat protein [Actinobacteria bacterium]|nr:MAG: tetratricopeptide repeat protein [Actinomycetota bacterium]
MRIKRIGIAIGIAVAMLLVGGIGLLSGAKSDAVTVAAPLPVDAPPAQVLAALQARLARAPRDWQSWAALGLGYVQSARRTGDPSFYSLKPGNASGLIGSSSLAAARHDFAAALRGGRQAIGAAPYNAGAYGVAGDALIELGRYSEAFLTFQRMIDLRPDLSSYARASYARELQGDVTGAIDDMNLALQAASSPADAAWAGYQLGELLFNSGRLDRAHAAYARAAAEDPTYVPAREGLAKVAAARGHYARAIGLYTGVVDRIPLPQYVIELVDVYTATGRPADAAQEARLLAVEERLARANGVNLDLEQATYDADHGHAAAALTAARAEWNRRHSVLVADALAWALYANKQYAEARAYSERALALGTRSALMWFHRGMIERALGHRAAARDALARALSINPSFSVRWAPIATKVLASLR